MNCLPSWIIRDLHVVRHVGSRNFQEVVNMKVVNFEKVVNMRPKLGFGCYFVANVSSLLGNLDFSYLVT